jgi:two-component system, cell cycle sensor histidine kinase and response regulator CckA
MLRRIRFWLAARAERRSAAAGALRNLPPPAEAPASDPREHHLRELAMRAPVGIFEADAAGDCVFANPYWLALTGLTLEQALDKGWLTSIHPDDREHVGAAWYKAVRTRRDLALEYRFLSPLGKLTWVAGVGVAARNDSGAITGYIGTVTDITDRKQTEDALRASESRYRLITENAHDLICLIDQDGCFAYLSPSFRRVLGYGPADLIGTRASDLLHPDDRAPILAQMQPIVSREPGQSSFRIRRADGSWCWVEAAWTNQLEQGQRYGIVSARDISERKRIEAQFLQAQKMESIGRLAGSVAHDFNNLLTAIGGYAELARETLADNSPARADLEEIGKAAQRARGLTRQLLAFARQQIIAPITLDLNDLVLDLEPLLRRLIGEHIAIQTRLSAGLGMVRADPGQIEQVLVNLVVNARDAMPNGGRLLIETASASFEQPYGPQPDSTLLGDYCMLAVSDEGAGMDETVTQHLFEPFFTTKEPGQGTGLGLATCYGIVKQHGGAIWCYSEPGQGTTFKIYLPSVGEAQAAYIPARARGGALPSGQETILLVEDEPAVSALAARVLREQGYTVLEAANGEDALQLTSAHHDRTIDLLLTDVVLPYMSGSALASQLLERQPSLKLLYMSGYTDQAIVRHGRLQPSVAFIQKPFSPAALARKVRAVLDQAPGEE